MVTIEEAQGSKELMGIFIEENMGLVGTAIKNLHIPHTEDYIQEGSIGLIKAARRFDASFGTTFSTYAISMIEGEIRRYRREYETTVKVPRGIKSIYFKSLRMEHLTDEELCKELNISIKELNEARLAMGHCSSLDTDVHKEDGGDAPITLHSIIASNCNTEDDAIENLFRSEIIDCLFQNLSEKQVEILELHLRGKSQQDIEKEVGLSQPHVSRILRKIINLGKQIAEGGIKLKITKDQLLTECKTLGTSEEAIKIIAKKYDMTSIGVKMSIFRNGILEKLEQERKQPPAQKIPASQIIPEPIVISQKKEIEIIQVEEGKKVSMLRVKTWEGKENIYSFQSDMLIIENNDGKVIVEDIETMIRELQELADRKEAV
jgi:RNA polymerase sigma factor (sigma-70 family)